MLIANFLSEISKKNEKKRRVNSYCILVFVYPMYKMLSQC